LLHTAPRVQHAAREHDGDAAAQDGVHGTSRDSGRGT
jgi:hypothetical protein